jgi:two-component system cell cycle sensor histidine kinase/response regulator CckA
VIEQRVRISVADDGSGIAEKNLPRIFTPFFTTKGTGTGLGLNLSREIIRGANGDLWVSSAGSSGATFTIDLPVAEQEFESEQGGSSDGRARGSSRSILVVDDEDHIAELIEHILTASGHKTRRLNDGATAVELLKKQTFDLLICDLHMPGASGRDVIEWVRHSKAGLEVLLLTGDVVSPETRQFVESSGVHFLSKPFSIEELKNAVEQAFR